jgi:hypothetical protein
MTSQNQLNPYYRLDDADATAADVKTGKIAYGPDGKVTGTYSGLSMPFSPTLDQYRGVIVDQIMPTGQAGSYTVRKADATVLDPSVTEAAGTSNTLSADGLLTPSGTSWRTIQNMPVIPALNGNARIWTFEGETRNSALTANSGIRWIFNHESSERYWLWRLEWYGTYYGLNIDQMQLGVYQIRSTSTTSSGAGYPAKWVVTCMETDRVLTAAMHVVETDDTQGQYYCGCRYDGGGIRAYRNSVHNYMQFKSQSDDSFSLRKFSIRDI